MTSVGIGFGPKWPYDIAIERMRVREDDIAAPIVPDDSVNAP